MKRDFTQGAYSALHLLVSGVEDAELGDFTLWGTDGWSVYEKWIYELDIKAYIDSVNLYHRNVIEKNGATHDSIDTVFTDVGCVDSTYQGIFANIHTNLEQWKTYIEQLGTVIDPSKGMFTPASMATAFDTLLANISQSSAACLKDAMVRNINGELIFNEDLIYEYMKKSPSEMTDAEMQALLEVISQLQDTVAFYESLATIGDDQIGADIWTQVAWLADDTQYASFTAVSMHYNDIYLNLLNRVSELSKDEYTFASALVKIGTDDASISLLGTKYTNEYGKLFGELSFDAYLAKYQSEHTEQYFLKLEASETRSLEIFNPDKIERGAKKAGNKFLENVGLRDEEKDEFFLDSNGNEIDGKKAPTFYDRQFSLAEWSVGDSASVSFYDGTFAIGENGKLNVVVGNAEAHASVTGGFYVIGANGEKRFSPGVSAEVGTSITAFEADWEQQLWGDENLGINADATLTVGKAEAKADGTVQFFNENGSVDVQLGASAKIEAIALEAEGSLGANVLGGEVAVTGGVNVGIGAHADVGYRDGVIKCDIGASLGVGFSIDVEIDVGGMVDTVCDGAASLWDSAVDGWNDFWGI